MIQSRWRWRQTVISLYFIIIFVPFRWKHGTSVEIKTKGGPWALRWMLGKKREHRVYKWSHKKAKASRWKRSSINWCLPSTYMLGLDTVLSFVLHSYHPLHLISFQSQTRGRRLHHSRQNSSRRGKRFAFAPLLWWGWWWWCCCCGRWYWIRKRRRRKTLSHSCCPQAVSIPVVIAHNNILDHGLSHFHLLVPPVEAGDGGVWNDARRIAKDNGSLGDVHIGKQTKISSQKINNHCSLVIQQ